MVIPSRFFLLGHEYKVGIVPAGEWKESKCVAFLHDTAREVHIMQCNRSTMEHAFMHELVHASLQLLGRDELSADEAFVDLLSGLLHQALTERN